MFVNKTKNAPLHAIIKYSRPHATSAETLEIKQVMTLLANYNSDAQRTVNNNVISDI